MYISEKIGDDYIYWGRKKIYITAPTGSGKSYFMVYRLLKYYARCGKKLLILCNRKLLRMQYWYQAVRNFTKYEEFREAVTIRTYQELAEAMLHGNDIEAMLYGYAGICMDEVHYFISDADFNPFGTYFVLQAVLEATLTRQVIFMSATMDCVRPWINRIYGALQNKHTWAELQKDTTKEAFEAKEYSLSSTRNYAHIQCVAVPDLESICEKVGHDDCKCLFFLDDKSKAEEVVEMLITYGEVDSSDIARINADNLDAPEHASVINSLAMTNRFDCKILLTTAVLDNGVSIHDPEVRNVVIITESQVSFHQMLGRIRTEEASTVNLLFLIRSADVFSRRECQMKRILDTANSLEKANLYNKRFEIFSSVWNSSNGDDVGQIYKKVLVVGPKKYDLLKATKGSSGISYGNTVIALNHFAVDKLGALYKAEAEFHLLALKEPLAVIWEQMKWIQKAPEELHVYKSTFFESEWQEFKSLCLKIHEVENKEFGQAKGDLAKRFMKTILRDADTRGRSFSTEKFRKFLDKVGLQLVVKRVGGRNRYTVCETGEEKNHDADSERHPE